MCRHSKTQGDERDNDSHQLFLVDSQSVFQPVMMLNPAHSMPTHIDCLHLLNQYRAPLSNLVPWEVSSDQSVATAVRRGFVEGSNLSSVFCVDSLFFFMKDFNSNFERTAEDKSASVIWRRTYKRNFSTSFPLNLDAWKVDRHEFISRTQVTQENKIMYIIETNSVVGTCGLSKR